MVEINNFDSIQISIASPKRLGNGRTAGYQARNNKLQNAEA